MRDSENQQQRSNTVQIPIILLGREDQEEEY